MVNAAAAAAPAVLVSVRQIGITSVWLVGQLVLRVISNRSSNRGNNDIFGRL